MLNWGYCRTKWDKDMFYVQNEGFNGPVRGRQLSSEQSDKKRIKEFI